MEVVFCDVKFQDMQCKSVNAKLHMKKYPFLKFNLISMIVSHSFKEILTEKPLIISQEQSNEVMWIFHYAQLSRLLRYTLFHYEH